MRKLMVALTLGVLCGCASHGKKFDMENANLIHNGMTREQVIHVMEDEKPYAVTNRSFTYLYASASMFRRAEARRFTVFFNSKGKAYGVPEGGFFEAATNPAYMDD